MRELTISTSIIFLLLMIGLVSAVCQDSSCSDITFQNTEIDSANYNPFLPYYDDNLYRSCSVNNYLFTPISGDIDNDAINELIVVSTSTQMTILDPRSCTIKNQFNTRHTITVPPSLVDIDIDGVYEIAIAGEYNVSIIQYNGTIKDTINYNVSSAGNYTAFGCEKNYCFGQYNLTGIQVINVLYSLSINANNLSALSSHGSIANKLHPNYIFVQRKGTDLNDVYASYCYGGSSTNIYCSVIDTNGIRLNSNSSGVSVSTLERYFAGFVKMGGVYRWIYGYQGLSGANKRSSINVMDDLYSTTYLYKIEAYNLSLPSVGDYDKDGVTELCYMSYHNSGYFNFTCYTNTFIAKKYEIYVNMSTTNISSFPFTFDMAYTNYSDIYASIYTPEGIFYITPTTQTQYFPSGYQPTGVTTYSDGISFTTQEFYNRYFGKFTGSTIYAYSDSIQNFVFSPFIATASCGNTVCDSGETILTCPEDCVNGTSGNSSYCITSLDCPSLYPTCSGHQCVAGLTSIPCIDSTQCVYNASICSDSGFCIAGVFNSSTSLSGDSTVAGSVDPNIIWSLIFSGSALWRFFVGMIMLIILAPMLDGILNKSNSPITTIMIWSGMLVCFTVVALINVWVILTIIVLAIALGIGSLFLKIGNTEG